MHFNLILGGRYEYNYTYGSAFAPRIGLTRVFNKFHFKILASQAFRTPSIGNIDVSHNLKVEKTLVLETEVGYKINDNMFVTGNIFDITIKDPIIYYDDNSIAQIPGTDWGYTNASIQGSDGLELEYRYKYVWGFSTINYSIYTERWKQIPDYYSVPGHPNTVLGLPQNKLTLLSNFKLADNSSISPSIIYTGVRYGYALGGIAIQNFNPTVLINLNYTLNNILTKGLNLDFGVFNILNVQSPYIEPYNGGYPPYPGLGREIIARLTYKLN
jgi:outer membrane receptor for ferrienterochelin and colicin